MKIKPTTIRFPPELLQRAQRAADKAGRTRTNLMLHLIDEGLKRLEATDDKEGVFS